MRRLAPAVIACSLLACATRQPCNPGLALVNATAYAQTAAEYQAAARQTYGAARLALDTALAQQQPGSLPPAIILDLDETVLDNSEFESRAIRAHKTYDSKMWKAWTAEAAARAVPGAAEFLQYAQSRGVTPFYITNRDVDEESGTRRNLEQLGFPLDPKIDTLLMQGKNGWTTSDKSPRRAHVAATHRILLVIGDDLNDFAPASGKTLAQRNAIVDEVRNWWGEVWFVVPNPMYGSWERALTGSGGTPCEQVQKKIEALR